MKIERDLKSEKSKYILSSNRVFIPVLFIVVSIVLECIQFKILGYDSSFPQVSLFNISVILIIAGIIYLSKYTPAMLSIFFVFIGLQIVINLVNANIFFIYGDLFTIDYLFLGDEGAAAFEWGFLDFNSIFLYIGDNVTYRE